MPKTAEVLTTVQAYMRKQRRKTNCGVRAQTHGKAQHLRCFGLPTTRAQKLFIEKPSQRLTAAHSGNKAFEFSSPQLFPFAVGMQAHTKFTLRCYTPQSVLPKQNGTKRRCRVTVQAQNAQTFALWEVYAPQRFSKQKSVVGRFFCRENFDCVTKNTIRIEFLLA